MFIHRGPSGTEILDRNVTVSALLCGAQSLFHIQPPASDDRDSATLIKPHIFRVPHHPKPSGFPPSTVIPQESQLCSEGGPQPCLFSDPHPELLPGLQATDPILFRYLDLMLCTLVTLSRPCSTLILTWPWQINLQDLVPDHFSISL